MTDKPKMTEVWVDGEHFAKTKEWVGLTEEDFVAINQSCSTKLSAAMTAESILRKKNT